MLLSERFTTAMVTGAAGFIGSHLVDSLLAEGLSVIAIDDLSAGKLDNLSSHKDNPKLKIVECDITCIDDLKPHFNGVDIVFHQAVSKNTISFSNPARDLEVNALGTLNMLICAQDSDVKKFIHASTGSVYGEAQYYPTDEKHLFRPAGYYGVSKLAGEQYVRVFTDLYGLDTIILRYYHVFGPRQDSSDVGGVVSIFARKVLNGENPVIYGDGTQLRSFTYVDDVVAINKHTAMLDGFSGEAFNCASGAKVTIQELADSVLKYFNRNDLKIIFQDWKPGDVLKFDVSNKKLLNTGFKFNFGFEQGLALTLKSSIEYLSK
jgi:UDP-glucose 4-epimerase